MIFQLNYKSDGKYDRFFESNKRLTENLDYRLYNDEQIETFLDITGWSDKFHSAEVDPKYQYMENALKCDYLRLMILHEFGGVYIDADTIFNDAIVDLENDLLKKHGNRNVVLSTRSLYFIRGIQQSPYLKHLLYRYDDRKIKLDILMNQNHNLLEFNGELNLVPPTSLEKYFSHSKITTL